MNTFPQHEYRRIVKENSENQRSLSFRGCGSSGAPALKDSLPESAKDAARSFYRWSTQLSAALVRCRQKFGGDLDQLLIYMVFVDSEASRCLSEGAEREGPRGLNALSVADITGIARETTRRKLRVLTDAGFLRYGQDGLHYLAAGHASDQVYADLQRLFLSRAAA